MKRKEIHKIGLFLFLTGLFYWFHNYNSGLGAVVENNGLSFGWLAEWTGLSGLVLLVLGWYWWKENSLGLMLIMVGGLVNLIDRLRFGAIRDYWSLGFGGIVNNINDYVLGLGVLLFILELWKKKLR